MEKSSESPQRNGGLGVSPAPPAHSEAIRRELQKMLFSLAFQGAERHQNFLTYVVEETLEGRANLLKEYSVGIEVFGRGEAFDPRVDTIVRVEARKLRARIAKYYESEGKQDPIRIEFNKGNYAPVFQDMPSPTPLLKIPPEASVSIDSRSRRNWSIAVVAVVVFGGLAAYFLLSADRTVGTPSGSPSIAVLPFTDAGEEKNEFFSDGLTDELIDSLGRVPGLHVVGRTSAFQFKGKALDLREIGNKLNVRTVLEGSVRQSNGRVRITAELDDASNGFRLWSQSYDRELKDILAIQREISTAIVNALSVALSDSRSSTQLMGIFSQSVSVNGEAYEDYLKGRYFWNKSTAGNINTAIRYFEQAIAKDPNYALAYVGLAGCYVALPRHGTSTAREFAPKIRAAGTKALELDRTLGEAHLDLAQAFASEFDWTAAQSEFKKGLELSPGSAVGHRWYSTFLARVGRMEESLVEARKALEIDPVSLIASDAVGASLFRVRRYDDAIDQFQKTLAMDPRYGLARLDLGLVYLQKKMYSEGLAEIQTARQLLEGDLRTTAKLGYAYAASGHPAEARKILDDFLDQSRRGPFRSIALADVYLGFGDEDNTFRWLEKSIADGDSPPLKEDPGYDPIRSDPRFPKLLARMKLQ